jgi:hypothetical protein
VPITDKLDFDAGRTDKKAVLTKKEGLKHVMVFKRKAVRIN